MELVDTHCHIHHQDYSFDDNVVKRAIKAGVTKMICIGVDATDSQMAINYANKFSRNCWATVGLHPHDADKLDQNQHELTNLSQQDRVVAIGECGLDYYKSKIDKKSQAKALRFQIELALKVDLPLVIHIRDAYRDFWPIFDDYKGLKGVAHCFNAGIKELDHVLSRNLYVALNGIMTFTKDQAQLAAAKQVPVDKLLLETDAPFLTPIKHRGKINEPKNIGDIAEFLAELRQEQLGDLQKITTQNAEKLFKI